jgi:hypothetical protein
MTFVTAAGVGIGPATSSMLLVQPAEIRARMINPAITKVNFFINPIKSTEKGKIFWKKRTAFVAARHGLSSRTFFPNEKERNGNSSDFAHSCYGANGSLIRSEDTYFPDMARKQTRKKIRISGPLPKNRIGYTGRAGSHKYVLNKSDVLNYDGTTAFFYRDGELLYKKEVKGEELKKMVRILMDYGDVVLEKYFTPVTEENSSPESSASDVPGEER